MIVDNDADDDGVCDADEIAGCTDASACNYDSTATDEDNSCYYLSTWYADTDGDGLGDSNVFFTSCDQPAGFVSNSDDSCPDDVENDADGDGVCESDEIAGCTDSSACNYDSTATDDDGSCAVSYTHLTLPTTPYV